MTKQPSDIENFLSRIDRDLVRSDDVSTTLYSYDATNEFYFPSAVVRPRSPEDIRSIVLAANETKTAVIPRGAGTGFSGGSLPASGGVVIDLLSMNRILDIDEASMCVRVQPGLITLALQETVEQKGLFYPPDPASLKTCTLGGNVAENAGGPRCLKYGVTRDYVMEIKGFTGDGKPFTFGKPVIKNRAGYDLKNLAVGSEGTLGVFHEFLLRLVPKPETKMLFTAFFNDFNTATEMVNLLLHKGISPSCVEFMDEFAIRAVEAHSKFGLPLNYQALLLIEIDGRHDEMPSLRRKTEECLSVSAQEIRVAIERQEQDVLWEIRRKTSPALRAFGNKKANEDIAVPRKSIPAAIRGLRQIAEKHSLNLINFGHIGDGNIHVNIMYDGNNPRDEERVEAAIGKIFELVNGFDGAISGEHGIGITKRRFLPRNIDPVSYELMRSVKRIFDPNQILNPEKMLY